MMSDPRVEAIPARDERAHHSSHGFALRIKEVGSQLLVRVSGPLDLENDAAFLRELRRQETEARQVVVDLRDADYLDSAGVRALLQLKSELEGHRAELRLIVQTGSRAERTLRLLQLLDHLHTTSTPPEARTTA
jgi:anti-anti-sigma factor